MYPANPTVRRASVSILAGIGVGIVIGIAAIFAAIMSAGAGHGSYVVARALFPFSLLLTQVEGAIGPVSTCVGLLQFPLYGALIGWLMASNMQRGILILVLAHLVAVFACFSGLLPNFS